MKVGGSGPIKGPGAVKKTGAARGAKPASGPSFADALDNVSGAAPTDESQASPLVTAAAPVDALLALQETGDEQGTPRQMLERGHSMLDELEKLQLDLLLGRVPSDRLKNLWALVKTRQRTVTDPKLQALLADIEIRVAVELAKLGVYV